MIAAAVYDPYDHAAHAALVATCRRLHAVGMGVPTVLAIPAERHVRPRLFRNATVVRRPRKAAAPAAAVADTVGHALASPRRRVALATAVESVARYTRRLAAADARVTTLCLGLLPAGGDHAGLEAVLYGLLLPSLAALRLSEVTVVGLAARAVGGAAFPSARLRVLRLTHVVVADAPSYGGVAALLDAHAATLEVVATRFVLDRPAGTPALSYGWLDEWLTAAVRPPGGGTVSGMRALPALRELRCEAATFGGADGAALAAAAPWLERLHLDDTFLQVDAFRGMGLPELPHLSSVRLFSVNWAGPVFDLAVLCRGRSLDELWLPAVPDRPPPLRWVVDAVNTGAALPASLHLGCYENSDGWLVYTDADVWGLVSSLPYHAATIHRRRPCPLAALDRLTALEVGLAHGFASGASIETLTLLPSLRELSLFYPEEAEAPGPIFPAVWPPFPALVRLCVGLQYRRSPQPATAFWRSWTAGSGTSALEAVVVWDFSRPPALSLLSRAEIVAVAPRHPRLRSLVWRTEDPVDCEWSTPNGGEADASPYGTTAAEVVAWLREAAPGLCVSWWEEDQFSTTRPYF